MPIAYPSWWPFSDLGILVLKLVGTLVVVWGAWVLSWGASAFARRLLRVLALVSLAGHTARLVPFALVGMSQVGELFALSAVGEPMTYVLDAIAVATCVGAVASRFDGVSEKGWATSARALAFVYLVSSLLRALLVFEFVSGIWRSRAGCVPFARYWSVLRLGTGALSLVMVVLFAWGALLVARIDRRRVA
jgi:hypothetical protein